MSYNKPKNIVTVPDVPAEKDEVHNGIKAM
jgi:hypothetical protein